MEKYIILLPNILEGIKKVYFKEDINDKIVTQYINDNFIYNNQGILFREEEEGRLKIWGTDFSFICVEADEENTLKVIAIKETKNYQYVFALEKGDMLEGDWSFISIEEANHIKKKSSWEDYGQMNFISDELSEHRKTSFKKRLEYKRYVEYWENLDITKKYEEEVLTEHKKLSVSKYKKFTIDFDSSIIKLKIENTEYNYRPEERVVISTKDNWNKNYQLNNDHINKIRGTGLGIIERYDQTNNLILIKSQSEIIKKITGDKDYKKGYIWIDDRGSRSKLRREYQALKKLFRSETVNQNLKEFVPEIGCLEPIKHTDLDENLFSNKFKNKFTECQVRAVKGALSCSDIYLIQGPPGTGKTTVISEIIHYLAKDNKKVLLSSQTNLAVDNVLQNIGDKENVRAIRIGRENKFLLKSKNFALDQRVNELQNNIISKINQREEKYKKIKKELIEFKDSYNAHKYIKDKIKVITNILLNYNEILKELESLKVEKQTLDEDIEKLMDNIGIYKKENEENIEILDRLSDIQEKSKNSLYDNIIISKISKKLKLSKVDERDIENYTDIIEEINQSIEEVKEIQNIQRQKDLERNKLLESQKKTKFTINYLIKQSREIKPDLKPYLNREIEHRKNKYNLKDIEYEINRCSAKRDSIMSYIEDLKQKAVDIKGKLEHFININSNLWLEVYNEPKITKKEFIEVFKQLKLFNKDFHRINDHIDKIDKLESYRKYKDNLSLLGELNKELGRIKLKLTDKLRYRDEFNNKINEYKENRNIVIYLNEYNIKLENLQVNKELERSYRIIEDYKEKIEQIELYESTKDIQSEWADKLNYYQESFENIYINISNLICATCLGIASTNNNYFLDKEFDYVIIDEAARASSMELLIPMIRGKKIVLVGDHKQISPQIERNILKKLEEEVAVSEEEIKSMYKKSLFGIMYEDADDGLKSFLNEQFRMNNDISKIVSKYFYDKELENAQNIKNKRHGIEDILNKSFYWINTGEESKYKEKEESKSYYNKGEIEVVKNTLSWLDNNIKEKKKVGIISPYKVQTIHLENEIEQSYKNLEIEINTIDAFQGREKHIIIMSLVRNNSTGRVGHMGCDSRINVAISRAQELLFIIGNGTFIKNNKWRTGKLYNIYNELSKNNSVLEKNF